MIPVPPIQWLRAPANRTIIERWTRPGSDHRLHLPEFQDGPCAFLVLGDTGDSEVTGADKSPQSAIAEAMAREAGLVGDLPPATPVGFVVHTGDVVYMSGERRLYDRNFRRPYEAFLTPESTFPNLVFRLPFLPVPGNHDYYDFWGVAAALVRLPLIGAGLRTLARELFDFSLPQGGSEMGRAYMEAFLDGPGGSVYEPGVKTRLPNRYYQYRAGLLDVWAIDSNTLDAPAPASGRREAREEAQQAMPELKATLARLEGELLEAETRVRARRRESRLPLASPERRRPVERAAGEVARSLQRLRRELRSKPRRERRAARRAARAARRDWGRALDALRHAADPQAFATALESVDRGVDSLVDALEKLDSLLLGLAGTDRDRLLELRGGLERAFQEWRQSSCYEPSEAARAEVDRLREEILDTQRAIARESRRARFTAADHDHAQIEWLRRGLEESARERPRAWRVAYLHHPPWTTGTSYCENDEIQSVRENLLEAIRGRVHLVIAGHSHAFEWIRTTALPGTAVVVSGGGGQVNLARSVLDPERTERHRRAYTRLKGSGVEEAVFAGRGPSAPDGARGPLHHYLKVEVEPDVLRVVPIGVRRMNGDYRVEHPMPVHHATLKRTSGSWQARLLRAVVLERGHEPRPLWG